MRAGIDEHGKCLDAIVGPNAGEANLADAGGIATGGLDIQCDKPKIPIWDAADMLQVWAGRGDHILDCQALLVYGVHFGFLIFVLCNWFLITLGAGRAKALSVTY
jgi:hypothetical protein